MQDLTYKEIESQRGICPKRVDNALCRIRNKVQKEKEALTEVLVPYNNRYAKKLSTSEESELLEEDSFGYWSLGIKILEGLER